MNSHDYQHQAARTLIPEPGFEITGPQMMTIWCAVGLTGEAGEVAELVKKGILHRHGLDVARLAKELGDVMWYVAGLCTIAGLDLGAVMQENIDKLRARYPNGFSPTDSIARADQPRLIE